MLPSGSSAATRGVGGNVKHRRLRGHGGGPPAAFSCGGVRRSWPAAWAQVSSFSTSACHSVRSCPEQAVAHAGRDQRHAQKQGGLRGPCRGPRAAPRTSPQRRPAPPAAGRLPLPARGARPRFSLNFQWDAGAAGRRGGIPARHKRLRAAAVPRAVAGHIPRLPILPAAAAAGCPPPAAAAAAKTYRRFSPPAILGTKGKKAPSHRTRARARAGTGGARSTAPSTPQGESASCRARGGKTRPFFAHNARTRSARPRTSSGPRSARPADGSGFSKSSSHSCRFPRPARSHPSRAAAPAPSRAAAERAGRNTRAAPPTARTRKKDKYSV